MRYALIVSALALFIAAGIKPAQKKLTGRQIAEKVYNRDDGADSIARMEMILVDKKGRETKRQLIMKLRDKGALNHSFLEFTEPADIAGTKFLTLEVENGDATQYLFLPALGRARRIVGGQKKQSFVNTDFSYEDMSRRKPDRDKQTLIKEEKWNGFNCYVIKVMPVKPDDSQYSKSEVWVDKQSFVVVKVDFYNKKGKKSKQLTVGKLERQAGIWTAMTATMKNFKRKTSTILLVKGIKYNTGLEEKIFALRNLEEK
ncbi:MAG: outer membrane lipoprotein-sorting protein [Elusimicrobia bacterium]|nr:outer membrane lipoprotein-sorting protein [Candidatus Omnitrophota bacterium]MCG2725015.1 outer membrane lipoprotein-sorting protein [Elusimicrobiota bacterium]